MGPLSGVPGSLVSRRVFTNGHNEKYFCADASWSSLKTAQRTAQGSLRLWGGRVKQEGTKRAFL